METINTEKQIIQQFNQYLQEDGKASSTVESYAGDIATFVAWLEEKVACLMES